MKLFGKAKKAPSTAESIHKIKETMDMLDKREKYLQTKIDAQLAEAKNFSKQRNKRGLHALLFAHVTWVSLLRDRFSCGSRIDMLETQEAAGRSAAEAGRKQDATRGNCDDAGRG